MYLLSSLSVLCLRMDDWCAMEQARQTVTWGKNQKNVLQIEAAWGKRGEELQFPQERDKNYGGRLWLVPHQVSRDVCLHTKVLWKWVTFQGFLQGMNSASRLKQDDSKESWRHHRAGGQGDHPDYSDDNILSSKGRGQICSNSLMNNFPRHVVVEQIISWWYSYVDIHLVNRPKPQPSTLWYHQLLSRELETASGTLSNQGREGHYEVIKSMLVLKEENSNNIMSFMGPHHGKSCKYKM